MESVFEFLASNLQIQDEKVVPVYCGDDGASSSGLDMSGGDVKVQLAELRTRWKIPTLRSLGNAFWSLVRLAILLRRVKPSTINCHYVDFRCLYFALLKPFFRYRLVLTCHGSDVMQPSSLDRRVQPFIFRSADHITTVSPQLRREVLERVPDGPPVTVIPNGIDLAFWQAVEWSPSGPLSIVSVGTLRPVKGHDVLIDAFSSLKERCPDAQLTLIGEGPEEEALVAQAERLGVQSGITFAGWCGRAAVREHLRGAHVFAFPSRSEGLGLALIEALAVGVPCVATNVGGIPEVVCSSDVGRLVPPEDPEALAQELVRVLENPTVAKQLSTAGRERARAFSWGEALDAYERVLRT